MDLSSIFGCYLKDGKGIIKKGEKICILEVYQSKISEVEGMKFPEG